jgi:PAS domain S-box-containing protein
MTTDPRMAPWRAEAVSRGYASSLALPVMAADTTFGAVTIYSGERDAFSDEEVELLGKLAGEVAHGIQLLRLRQAHQDAEEALRLSEEKFALAFANNPAAISMTVLEDGRFVDVNDTWQGLMGYQREEVLGRSARQMGIWPTPEAAARYVKELREKGSLRGWEQEFQTRSGQTFVAQLAAQVLTIGGEKVVLSTLVDITRRKRAEEAVRRSEERLERLVAERTAKLQELVGELEHFSYTITHDMRAPLRAMRGFSEAVLEMCADCAQEKQRDFLRRIMAGADRMDALIRDALNYSRAVRQELPQETVDVAKLLRGMLESYRS